MPLMMRTTLGKPVNRATKLPAMPMRKAETALPVSGESRPVERYDATKPTEETSAMGKNWRGPALRRTAVREGGVRGAEQGVRVRRSEAVGH